MCNPLIQMFHLRWVRQHVTDETAVLVANPLVKSLFYYCNSLSRSLSSFNMYKLQDISNTLARIVTNCNKYPLASPVLKRLHWLPIEFHCIFKTATLFYNFLIVVIPVILILFCLLVVKDIVQDTTVQVKSSWRFLNSINLYINGKTLWSGLYF